MVKNSSLDLCDFKNISSSDDDHLDDTAVSFVSFVSNTMMMSHILPNFS